MGGRDFVARQAVGRHLRRLRKTLGWTLEKAASRASGGLDLLTASTLSRLERGESAIPVEALSRLCHCLGTNLASVDEVIRAARERSGIDLEDISYEQLLEEGHRSGSRGDISGALARFEAAEDWVLMQEAVEDRDRLLAKALLLQAQCLKRMRRFSRSLEAAGRVLNLGAISLDERVRALVIRVEVAYWKGDFYEAELFARALRKELEAASSLTKALGYAALGNFAFEREEWEQAEELLEKARALYAEQSVGMEVARMEILLGYCRHRLGDSVAGRKLLDEALAVARRQGYAVVAAFGLRMRARLEREQGNTEQSFSDYEAAAEMARKLEMPDERFMALFGAWSLCGAAGAEKKAERFAGALRRVLPKVSPGLPEAEAFRVLDSAKGDQNTRRGS